MDAFPIKTEMNRSEDEPPVLRSHQPLDPAFLQLLASLGLTPQTAQVTLATGSEGGDSLNVQGIDSQETLTFLQQGVTTGIGVDTLQGKDSSAEAPTTNAGDVDSESMVKALLAEQDNKSNAYKTAESSFPNNQKQLLIATQAETNQVSADGHASDSQAAEWITQSLATVSKTDTAKQEHSNASMLDGTKSGDIPPLHDRNATDHTALVLGSPSLSHSPANAVTSSSDATAYGKDASSNEHSLMWKAAIEGDVSPAGKEARTPSSERQGKVDTSQHDAGISQTFLTHAVPPVSPPSEPVPVRSVAAAAPIVNIPPSAPDSPLTPSVRFEVHPDEMGRVRVHLSVVDHTVYTNVLTDRVEAHDFLIKNSERFETGLAAHGLDVGRFQVDVHTQGREQQHERAAWSGGEGQRQGNQPAHPENEWHPGERASIEWEKRMVNVFA